MEYKDYSSPFNNREERRRSAIEHTNKMESLYKDKINESLENTTILRNADDIYSIPKESEDTTYILDDLDTISAIKEYTKSGHKVTALNFASYTNPGGKFIDGSSAQEEAICHESFLYNVLSKLEDIYSLNRKDYNSGLYEDCFIFTPNVYIESDKECKANILTCAAPNWASAKKYDVSLEKNNRTLYNRIVNMIRFLNITRDTSDVLILGAWGCGVFKQDPYFVASKFMQVLTTEYNPYKYVVFAVPHSKYNNNYIEFRNVLHNYDKKADPFSQYKERIAIHDEIRDEE